VPAPPPITPGPPGVPSYPIAPPPSTEPDPIVPPNALDTGLTEAAAATTELAPTPILVAEPELAPEPSEPLETEPAPEPIPDAVRTRRRIPLLAVAAVVLAALVAGTVTWLAGSSARAAQTLADRRAEALAQARTLVLNLVSIDYRTVDRDFTRIRDSETGHQRAGWDKLLSNGKYKALITESKAVLKGTIKRIGLEPCGADDRACRRGDAAVVLAFVDEENTNKFRTTPRVDHNRVAVTLVRTGHRWLISDLAVI
jgi:Mce-associated membrane protein